MRLFVKLKVLLIIFTNIWLGSARIASSDEFADELLIALFESDKFVPLNLLFDECWEKIPSEQRNFLLSKPSLNIFKKEEFKYEITRKNSARSPYKKYCIEPTHEFNLFNLHWNPTVSVLELDLIKIDSEWKIITPEIPDEIFRGFEESYRNVLNEYKNAKASLTDELVLRWNSMVKSGGAMVYAAIDEVVDKYEITWDAAVLLLTDINRMRN